MKEYKIGEEFEFEGVKLRCEESFFACNGCYFLEGDYSCNSNEYPRCSNVNRLDKTEVIFAEVKNG